MATLLSTPARVRILEALLDGLPRSATELSMIAGTQFSTGSSHLAKLVAAQLAICEQRGRHRFYRVAGPHVIDVVEALNELLPGEGIARERPLARIEVARTCYDHLAGRVGTMLTGALVDSRCLVPEGSGFTLTAGGAGFLAGIGVDVPAAMKQRRAFARRCLDWTDKRDHLGGALGAALLRRALDLKWLRQGPKPRLMDLTREGRLALRMHFGVESPDP